MSIKSLVSAHNYHKVEEMADTAAKAGLYATVEFIEGEYVLGILHPYQYVDANLNEQTVWAYGHVRTWGKLNLILRGLEKKEPAEAG